MRSLTQPDVDAAFTYRSIAESRRPAERKARLVAAEPAVLDAYETYGSSASEIVALAPANTAPATADDLKGNYESTGVATIKLKGLIHDNNKDGWCRLCGRAKASTLDHYLPQTAFPEFSVLPRNLVPACKDCNFAKRSTYGEEGEAVFIHAYVDEVPRDVRFLFADVDYRDGGPTVTFVVDPPADIEEDLARRLRTHFDRLGLAAEYQFEGASQMSELREMVKGAVQNGSSPNEVRQQLSAYAAAAQRVHGANYWRFALLDALAANLDFCSGR